MTRKAGIRGAVLMFACMLLPAFSDAPQSFVNGIFVSTPQGPVELITYGESLHNGQLKIQAGSLEDVPTVKPWARLRFLASLPFWQPVAVLVANGDIFRRQEPETRRLALAARKFNVYTIEVRAADLESVDKVASLFRSVHASEDAPGYVFIVLHSEGMTRYYPVRFDLER